MADNNVITVESEELSPAEIIAAKKNSIFKVDSTGEAVLDFGAVSMALGVAGVPLQSLPHKLESKDVVGKELTLLEVNIAQALNTAGERTYFPVCRFAEFPDSYYQGGGMLTKNVTGWLLACGEELLPGVPEELNRNIAKAGGIKMRLALKPNTQDRSKQDYVMVYFL